MSQASFDKNSDTDIDKGEDSNSNSASPFHPGERQVQQRAGVREEAEKRGQRMLSADINAQQAQFFRQLPFVLAAHTDDEGQPWATLLTGAPGFIGIDEQRRQAAIRRAPRSNPNQLQLRPGDSVGLLGIELATRRRNRLNGTVFASDEENWRILAHQTYGNCPRYINERPWPAELFSGTYRLQESPGLSPAARQLANTADTFFIASCSGSSTDDGKTGNSAWGADISHRGGEAGFLRGDGEQLVFEDYPGNNMFNTLGNISRHPRCGLLLLDFDSGDLVQLAAAADIDYQGESRSVVLDITRTRFWRKQTTC